MAALCLGSLRFLLPSVPHRWKRSAPLQLPNELWSEMFQFLDNHALVVVSRVNRAFNAMAIPIYLARHDIHKVMLNSGTLDIMGHNRDAFLILQTALFLPPIRKLICNCTVFWGNRFLVVRCLRHLIARQSTLEDLQLTFRDLFSGSKRGKAPSRAIQREIRRLLNSIMPHGNSLIIAGERALISSSGCADPWSLVRHRAPVRGLRDKVRKAALAVPAILKERKSAEELILHTACNIDGITCRDSYTLDALRSVHVKYAASPAGWSVIVLNANTVSRFRLIPSLSASDWSNILPALHLRRLWEFTIGLGTVYGDLDLCNVSMLDLDAFLARHPLIMHLEYCPNGPHSASEFSLASIPFLTHLTTTPGHFIHLHQAPNTFPELRELTLFVPPSTPVSLAQTACAEVLQLLSETDTTDPRLCLRFPGSWITPPPAGLAPIKCIQSLLIFGEFELNAALMAEFLAPFEPGLTSVEFHTRHGGMVERLRFVDQVRSQVTWLESVACTRKDSEKRTMARTRPRRTLSMTYDD
ncbi:hypothetical protein B0H11DRAFT_2041429 [Mycena galericulata]|nr:hypothetical protein B0H11DRAFT_2041429 [Mycena galericulata]